MANNAWIVKKSTERSQSIRRHRGRSEARWPIGAVANRQRSYLPVYQRSSMASPCAEFLSMTFRLLGHCRFDCLRCGSGRVAGGCHVRPAAAKTAPHGLAIVCPRHSPSPTNRPYRVFCFLVLDHNIANTNAKLSFNLHHEDDTQ